jgi:hypothetical protein
VTYYYFPANFFLIPPFPLLSLSCSDFSLLIAHSLDEHADEASDEDLDEGFDEGSGP